MYWLLPNLLSYLERTYFIHFNNAFFFMSDAINKDQLELFNHSPNCLLVVSGNFDIVSVSKCFCDDYALNIRDLEGVGLKIALDRIFARTRLKGHLYYVEIESWLKNHVADLSDKKTKSDFSRNFPGATYNAVEREDALLCILISFTNALLDGVLLDKSERESTLQAMADETDILISIVDDYGKVEYRNPAWERFIGSAMPGEGRFKWDEFIHPEDLEPFQTLLYSSIVARTDFSSEFRIKNRFGEFRWLRVEGVSRTSIHGRFMGYICTGLDITQIKDQIENLASLNGALSDAHAQLKSSKEELQAAFDAAEMGSCSLDLKTLKADMSVRYRQLYGLPLAGDINWDMVTGAVDADYKDEVNEVLSRAANFGTPVDSIYPIRHLISGEKRWMRVIGKVRSDDDGKPESVYAVVIDVSKRMEEESRKNRFIAMVSHELKTPLTSINGYVQLLAHKASRSSNAESIVVYRKILGQLKKMDRLIAGFLNISRLESGKLEITKGPFDIADLVLQLKEEFGTEVSTHQIVLQNTSSLIINADRDRIEMVIHNLLSNAVKYSPIGSEVLIAYGRTENALIFTVSDSGKGILEEEKSQVFDRYFKSESAQEKTIAGFGIGLFLCAEIINLHGGKIWADNLSGSKGAVFGFSLPV